MKPFPLITTILVLAILLLNAPASGFQPVKTITGTFVDAVSGEPVHGVHVYPEGSGNGAVSGLDGQFTIEIPQGTSTLVISHVAYQNIRLELSDTIETFPLLIRLDPLRLGGEELIVSAGRFTQTWSGIYSNAKTRPVEDHMAAISGLDMVSRANFAKEPVIRGLRDGRVNVMIDGMRMTPACVDGMDPITAYVESGNLQSIEISRGQEAHPIASTAPGGSVNFAMARPALNSGFSGSAESGYHSVSHQHLLQSALSFGDERWAVRLSGTYRHAGDLMAGNRSRIEGSGFEKGNFFSSLLFKPNEHHEFSLRYIGDFAGKIGYPKLLMDTRRADAHIAGLEHTWTQPSQRIHSITTNIYMNRVEHRMDDYDRDVTVREVMPDMFMPMYGETQTSGITTELKASSGSHLISLKLDAWSVDAFANMTMEHLNPGVSDMYLVNLGDVSQRNVSAGGSYRYFTNNGWILGMNGQLETGINRIRERSAVGTYRAEYPGLDELEPMALGYLIGLNAEKRLSERFQAGFRVSDGQRLPDHMERYGYYIYQPLDGFFYYGNPGLNTERSRQAELFFNFGSDHSQLNGSTSLWLNRMDRYIAGYRIDTLFKRYENMGSAVLAGFETDLNYRITSRWMAGFSAAYVRGHHNEFGEPLPMIPPLKGSFFLQREAELISIESRLRWAAPQNRTAEQNSLETPTGGYALWDLFTSVQPHRSITLRLGVENVLNTFYTDHLSVNAMPGAGRNVHAGIRILF